MFRLILIAALLCAANAQIQFEGIDTNQNRQPTSHNRQPIQSSNCSEGEYLYPGDNDKDWVCDCKPTYVYYPVDMKCYPVYSRGPCRAGFILVLSKGKAIPECIRNPCGENQVRYRDRCGRLTENTVCPNKHVNLLIDATTLEPTCAFLASRFEDVEASTLAPIFKEGYCYPGSKRNQNGTC